MGAVVVNSFAAGIGAKATVGSTAPSFTLQDENGKPVSLSDFAGKLVVLEWTNPECPFVKRHYAQKTMTTLASEYKGKDVIWLAINSTGTSSNATNLAWVNENGLSYPVLNDSAGEVGKTYGAKSTPEMYVINKDGKLAYRGAIDNDPSGEMAASSRINYVKQALDQLISGSVVSVPETKSYGCGVHYAH
jgi:peroxiredoxin